MISWIAKTGRRIGGWFADGFRSVVASFRGASHGRLFSDWGASALHPDQETRYALRDMRARARDLVRNNPYAAGIVSTFVDNIVGWEGIRLQPTVLGRDGKPDRAVNDRLLAAWKEWSTEYASADGVDSWLDVQRLIIRAWVTDGEVFIRQRPGWDNPHGYAVQLIDADLLDETFNVPPGPDGIEIRMGIEMDAAGRRLAYHFWERHPADLPSISARKRVRVPADEVLHFFMRTRPGQNRGYTLFAPVLSTVKMIDGYSEAELVAARLAAAKMGFITNNTDEAIDAYAQRLKRLNDRGDGKTEARRFEIAPALIDELLPGQSFQQFDPTHPSDAFEPFLKVMLRGVARGFGVSYMSITGDLEGANYSSMRAGQLPERDHWRVLQVFMHSRAHTRVYRSWRAMAMLSGALRLPSMVSRDFGAHSWEPRGWRSVDPLKDYQADEIALLIGVKSRTQIASDRGVDFRDVVDQLRDEQEYAETQGVYIGGSKALKGPQPATGEGDDEADESDDERTNGAGRPAKRLREVIQNGKH